MKNHSDDRRKKASEVLKSSGYGKMKDMVSEGVHEHESHMHKGKKETSMKFSTGGHSTGKMPKGRLDRKARAHGGRNKSNKVPHVSVNVINAGSKPSAPMPMGMPPVGAMPPRPMPPPPPAGGPGMPAGAPMGGMPPRPGMAPPVGLKSGGRARRAAGGPVKNKMDIPHLEGGSGGGLGRLEKANHEAKRKKTA